MNHDAAVRKPQVAGSFYPADEKKLRQNVSDFIDNVPSQYRTARPLVLLEPHAGYMYSGPVAANGYATLAERDINTVIIVCPSHMENFPFASVYSGDAYETPLGRISVNKSIARALVEASDGIELSDRGHIQDHLQNREHALEVQLPFLQVVLDDFKIVPVVMGAQDWDTCEKLGAALGPILKNSGVVLIASSDLSHFHSHELAEEKDRTFCRFATAMNAKQLFDALEKGDCEACGGGPFVASMIAASQFSEACCDILARANSGDVTGDRSAVVGYAAGVIYEGLDAALTADEKQFLLRCARKKIETRLGVTGTGAENLDNVVTLTSRPLFVTIHKRKRLRGCIGLLEPKIPLEEAVADMAEAAAFNDPRFGELSRDELEEIDIEISVLSGQRLIRNVDEIEVGTHGLLIQHGQSTGLLLPQVATEQGWDAATFIERTCEKAGLPRDAWQNANAHLYVFTADVFSDNP